MSEMKHKAKRAMLEKLKEVMGGMGADSVMGGMGVEVQAKDKKSLVEGLDKAKEVVEDGDMEESEEMEDENEEMEEDYESYSKEELIAMMKNK